MAFGTHITDRQMALDALDRMPESQRLAVANEMVLKAVDPCSVLVLQRIESAARIASGDLQRDRIIARAAS